MARIITIGENNPKTNPFKQIWSEITGLSFFTKLTILVVILFILVLIKTSGELLQQRNYASPQAIDVSKALPKNCHLAVDLTECAGKSNCSPTPKLACDKTK